MPKASQLRGDKSRKSCDRSKRKRLWCFSPTGVGGSLFTAEVVFLQHLDVEAVFLQHSNVEAVFLLHSDVEAVFFLCLYKYGDAEAVSLN